MSEHEDDIDILSNLPDSIICQIISKLETKEAVQTSLLSSRYESLWMNITSLSFKYRDFGGDAARLAHFVNGVLYFLKSKSIDEFYLKVETPYSLYHIPTWFKAAIGKNVKVLNLHIRGRVEVDNIIIPMPACLYTSKTLEFLKVLVYGIKTLILNVPEFISLPKLTKLELHSVKYSSDDSARRLISGCPSLEYLVIVRGTFDGVTTFTINSPTLKTLFYVDFESASGSIEHNFKFELNAPALRDFTFCDKATRDFSVVSSCLLESAHIMVSSPQVVDPESHYERVMKLLQGVFNVSHLWIAGHSLEALSLAPSLEVDLVLSELIMERKSLQDLFEQSTKFHELYLSKDSSDTTHVVRWSVNRDFPVFLPVCLLSYLETISVSGFRGRESELSMIAYILKNAKVLKKITISEATSETEANFELREKIFKFDQGSQRCEIIFS